MLALPAQAQMTAFKQAVATAASDDEHIAAFYQDRNYEPLWTAANGKARRSALVAALRDAPEHGLPAPRYDLDGLLDRLSAAKTSKARGVVEVEMSRVFLQYARDVQTGVLTPGKIDSGIVRDVPRRDRLSYLVNFAKSNPSGFFRALPPRTNEYARLMKEKMRLEHLVASGGWGPRVPAGALKPGATGNAVIALRNRLIAMGFMGRSATQSYDAEMQQAVQAFQLAHGLEPDGVAGDGTMTEVNTSAEDRLKSVMVAMERERWLNMPRGDRHILVNITDFSARIVDNDTVTFETRSVVGATASDRRTPEFSDVMEHMVINPTWHVPRSIAVKEYLPMLKRNRNAVSHLRVVDSRGSTVNRNAVDFSNYTARTFPFNIKQPPGQSNALGLVKFMFPNRYNIYLHDTPTKHLFSREVRAYSHGCVRLQEPFEFAYALLARQTNDPEGYFKQRLDTGRETVVPLEQPVPVHLIYRTAFTKAKGHTQYRRDIYGRDARIWNALSQSGVALRAVQG
ncbi:L,D-transpeptidase family protein [Lutimaribacter sp. EGI FJ00015]|uniref:L,D-transpeptidase family protein n=2 Tax=Lutimaribacter degradans TaxID=2945989 RepID=A0ACC5ZV29_9RHOB|nr:L,D-transpeptidase family protein [Lutimaribacter sp. EGI FJ00013]MCM2562204.1 L,D-transpeptidase family protein [Lutimaribacter sp. EGI FJ00013]MCO0613359.1 L,D-transpeptidase family protein [Lutimaribacter sp. EGI FJ00015]MCO0636333.1 L,D-transpeptidase family protein [Lutimaribacter sp. EGI FJ00014]